MEQGPEQAPLLDLKRAKKYCQKPWKPSWWLFLVLRVILLFLCITAFVPGNWVSSPCRWVDNMVYETCDFSLGILTFSTHDAMSYESHCPIIDGTFSYDSAECDAVSDNCEILRTTGIKTAILFGVAILPLFISLIAHCWGKNPWPVDVVWIILFCSGMILVSTKILEDGFPKHYLECDVIRVNMAPQFGASIAFIVLFVAFSGCDYFVGL
jgi:hypothetical protein